MRLSNTGKNLDKKFMTININHIQNSQMRKDILCFFENLLKSFISNLKHSNYFIIYIIFIDLSIYLSIFTDCIRDNVIISSIFQQLMTLSSGGLEK